MSDVAAASDEPKIRLIWPIRYEKGIQKMEYFRPRSPRSPRSFRGKAAHRSEVFLRVIIVNVQEELRC